MKRIRFYKSGFTLIEMLAVLFIIGIIFSITLPTFGPIMKTLKLTTSAENIANVLESARQYAITGGEICYVVFPVSTGTDMDYKAYKIYKPDSGTIGKWEYLPIGIKIKEGSTFIYRFTSVPFPDDTSSPQSLAYIECKPNGAFNPGGRGVDAMVTLFDVNDSTGELFQNIVVYNIPQKVKVKEVGER